MGVGSTSSASRASIFVTLVTGREKLSREQIHLVDTYLPEFRIHEPSTEQHRQVAASHQSANADSDRRSTATSTVTQSGSKMSALYDAFYSYLDQHAPELKPLFRSSLYVKGKILVHIIAGMRSILASDHVPEKIATLTKQDPHPLWRAARAIQSAGQGAAVRDGHGLGDAWTSEVADAWRRLFAHCSAMLMYHFPRVYAILPRWPFETAETKGQQATRRVADGVSNSAPRMAATGPDDTGTNPIAEKRRQRKLENQRLEAAARQRQEDLRLQKERELKRQEDERIAAEQRRLDEIERLTRLRETERERIATIERNEQHRVLAIERQLKLIGAFCTREIALLSNSTTRPQCCAVLSPTSLEKPIAGVDEPLAFVADASCHVRVVRLRDAHCLFRIGFEYETTTAGETSRWTEAATTPLTSLCTTRSGHLIVCNQQLGVVGAYDINQLLTLSRPLSLPTHPDKDAPVLKASPALAATFVFPKSGPAMLTATAAAAPTSRIRAVCVDDTANELFVSDRLRHCVHVLAMHPSAFQRAFPASSTAKHKAALVLARTFGTKGHGRGQLLGPAGLDVSHYHTVVCDRGNHRLSVFTKRGAFVCTFGGKGCRPGQFLDPRDVKLANVRKRALSRGLRADDTGISNEQFEIVVADLGNFRVQVLNENGEPLRVLSMLAGADQIQFHQDFLAARSARLLELFAGIDTAALPSLAGSDLQELFVLAERLHPSSNMYQQITDNVRAVREDAARFHHPRGASYLSKEREIVVLDRQNDSLFVYSIDGSMSVWTDLPPSPREPSAPPRGLSSAHTSVVMRDRVYVSDPLSHRIAVLTHPSLAFERFIGATTHGDQALCSEGFVPGELRFPTYLATYVDHETSALCLLVADSGNHCVSVFDASLGTFRGRIGLGFGHLEGFFDSPQGLAVLENRWLYVCDQRNHRIQVFDLRTNAFVRAVGAHEQGSAPGAFSFPLSVAVCEGLHTVEKCNFGPYRDAKYCVGDAGNHRVQVLDMRDDSVLFILGAASTPFETPMLPAALLFHEQCSYLLVADTNNRSVAVFRHDGTFVAAFGSNLEPENCFQRPTGLQLLLRDASTGNSGGDPGAMERVVVTDAMRMAMCTFELRAN